MKSKCIFVTDDTRGLALVHDLVFNFVQQSSIFEVKLLLILTPLQISQDSPTNSCKSMHFAAPCGVE